IRSAYGACSTRRCMARCQARRAYGARLITGCFRSAGTLRCAGASSSTRVLFKVLNVWKACRKPTTANPCLLELKAENPKISAMVVAPVESWPVACCHNPSHNGSPSIASRSLGFRIYRGAKFFGDDTSLPYREIEDTTAKEQRSLRPAKSACYTDW